MMALDATFARNGAPNQGEVTAITSLEQFPLLDQVTDRHRSGWWLASAPGFGCAPSPARKLQEMGDQLRDVPRLVVGKPSV